MATLRRSRTGNQRREWVQGNAFRSRKLLQVTSRNETDPVLASAVVDTAAALVVVMDCQGRILRWNPASERLTQFTEEEVLGRHLWEVVQAPEQAAPARDELRR